MYFTSLRFEFTSSGRGQSVSTETAVRHVFFFMSEMAKAVLYRGLWGFAIAVTRTTAVPTASLSEFVITIMTDNCSSRPSSVVCRLSLGWVSLMKFKWTYEYYRSDLCDLLSRRGGVGNRFMNGLCGLEINFLYLLLRESRVEMVNCRVSSNWEEHSK